MSIHIAAKSLCRYPPQAKKIWGKNSQGCQRLPRLPEAPGRSQGPREAQRGSGLRGSKREWEGARGVRGSKGSKAPESDWRPKPAEGFQRLPRIAEAPGRSQGPKEVPGGSGGKEEQEGARGIEGEQGKQGPWVWLKTQTCRRLPKAPKDCWGPRKVPGAKGGPGRQGGVRWSKGDEGEQGKQGPQVWLKTQGCWRLPKAPKAFWGPRKVPGAQGTRRSEGSKGGEGEQGPCVWLKTQGCQRLPKAPKASWGPRKFLGSQGGSGGEVSKTEVGGNGDWGVCFGVPTTCGANFWGAHHLSWTKSPSPCSQLSPLTHNWLSGGRA